MTIKHKLYLAYGLLAAITVISTAIATTDIITLRSGIGELSQRYETATYVAGQIDTITSDMQAEQRGMLLRSLLHQEDAAGKLAQDSAASIRSLHKFLEQDRGLVSQQQASDQLQIISNELRTVDKANGAFLEQVQGKHLEEAVRLLDGGLAAATDRASTAGATLLDLQQKLTGDRGSKLMEDAVADNWVMIGLLLPMAAAGIGVIFIIRKLDRQLRQSVEELKSGSEQVAGAANQVSSSSQTLATSTSSQAAMIEETSASSEQINSMARRNTEHAVSTAQQMTALKLVMEASSREMANAMNAMDEMNHASAKISQVIQVIDKIAFQTNILALNAAVEAARSGEAGAGFAVVADEVRSLAQQCAGAAKDSEALIGQSQSTSKLGSERFSKVAEEIQKMSSVLGHMHELIAGIESGSQEQSQGIAQISKAITLMEQGTQRSAATAEESAAAAQQLTAQSQVLRDVAEQLEMMVGAA